MKRHIRTCFCAGAGLVLTFALFGHAVFAEDCTGSPFDLNPNGDSQLIAEHGNCFTRVGTGTATHMGDVMIVNEICQFGFRAVNNTTLVAANGDELYIVRHTEYNFDTERFEGTFEIVGGSGRFEEATGYGIAIQGQGLSGVICY